MSTTRALRERLLALWLNRSGQDLIEYSLAAGFVAVTAAGFLPPAVAPALSSIYSKIDVLLKRVP